MKKTYKWLALLLILVLSLSACTSQSSEPAEPAEPAESAETPEQPAEAVTMSWSLGGTSGGFYVSAAPICEYINSHSSTIRVVPTTSGGSFENANNVAAKSVAIGCSFPYDAENVFNDGGSNLRFVGPSIAPDCSAWIVLADSGISTLEDLKGKRVCLGAAGSAARTWAESFVNALGIYDTFTDVVLSADEQAESLLNGDIDCFVCNVSTITATARVTEAASSAPISIIDLGSYINGTDFLSQYPYFSVMTISKDFYKDLTADITTFGARSATYCDADLPADVIYEFCSYAYSEEAQGGEGSGSSFDWNSSDPCGVLVVPIHEGAEKYWTEKGVKIAEPLNK